MARWGIRNGRKQAGLLGFGYPWPAVWGEKGDAFLYQKIRVPEKFPLCITDIGLCFSGLSWPLSTQGWRNP